MLRSIMVLVFHFFYKIIKLTRLVNVIKVLLIAFCPKRKSYLNSKTIQNFHDFMSNKIIRDHLTVPGYKILDPLLDKETFT